MQSIYRKLPYAAPNFVIKQFYRPYSVEPPAVRPIRCHRQVRQHVLRKHSRDIVLVVGTEYAKNSSQIPALEMARDESRCLTGHPGLLIG